VKLSNCSYSYRDLFKGGGMTMEAFLDNSAALGLDGVELTQYYFPEETDEFLNHLKREAHRRGLDVAGAAVGGNFINPDAGERQKQIEHVKDWLVKAAKLGAPILRVFAGPQPQGVDYETCEDWVQEGLTQCAVTAAKHGVVLALENHGGVTATGDGVLSLMEPLVDNPWIGLNLDFGNFTGDVYDQFRRCARLAVTTHAKVTCRQGDERRRIDYRKVVHIMREAGYHGYLSIEFEEPAEPLEGVSHFAAYLRGCIVDA